MKKMVLLLIIVHSGIYANIWNTPDYSQPAVITVQKQPAHATVAVEREYSSRPRTYVGRPVRTAVESAANTLDVAGQSVLNILHSDRPVTDTLYGAADTADSAVQGASNIVHSIID